MEKWQATQSLMKTVWLSLAVLVALLGLGWVVLNPPRCQPDSPRIVLGGDALGGVPGAMTRGAMLVVLVILGVVNTAAMAGGYESELWARALASYFLIGGAAALGYGYGRSR